MTKKGKPKKGTARSQAQSRGKAAAANDSSAEDLQVSIHMERGVDSTETVAVLRRLPVRVASLFIADYKSRLIEAFAERAKVAAQWAITLKDLKDRVKTLHDDIEREASADGADAGGLVAGLIDQLRTAETNLGEATSKSKADLAALSGSIDRMAMVINTGVDYTEVECTLIRDFHGNCVSVSRDDTKEVISQRVMTDAERQEPLPEE